jgi:hypothetical protein
MVWLKIYNSFLSLQTKKLKFYSAFIAYLGFFFFFYLSIKVTRIDAVVN